jgi:hypothetical protein
MLPSVIDMIYKLSTSVRRWKNPQKERSAAVTLSIQEQIQTESLNGIDACLIKTFQHILISPARET